MNTIMLRMLCFLNVLLADDEFHLSGTVCNLAGFCFGGAWGIGFWVALSWLQKHGEQVGETKETETDCKKMSHCLNSLVSFNKPYPKIILYITPL